ncbi:MAG: Omp28-related outer membrane protein [Bacteroidetes bacterium]|nr:Omp28-related outer membrane protein [Bacteroidota bacterium]
MKNTLLTIVATFLISFAFSQAVQRNMVILEIGTGTGCQYCPGSAMGAQDLLASGANVAVLEYHNYNPSSDPFYNAAAGVRCGYYGISGYPTAYFDGTVNYVGGSTSVSMFPQYLPLYNQQYAVLSPLTIDIAGYNVGNLYTITLTITKVAAITATNLKAHLALTESGIVYSWQGQSEINDAERLMAPDAGGTSISFALGNTVTLTQTFTKDPSWVINNCELIAFVQDNGTKTIFNGAKKALNALALPLPTNFSATPTSGCTPMTVNFTDQSTGATSWNWSFPGGSPSTSTLQNPVVVYNAVGSYDVTLNAFNIAGNQAGSMSKPAYINLNSAPIAPGAPQGLNGLCIDPPDQTYTTNAVPNTTGYSWELLPASAGALTNNGTSCVINWDNTFTGIAQLKVRAVNGCGNSPWTSFLNITISAQPGQAAIPTGPASLCMNPGSTSYTTAGASNAGAYIWELLPAEAGSLYPNGTSLSVAWSSVFSGTATLKVKGVNNSCEGAWSALLSITVTPGPVAFNITGGGVYCAIGGSGIAVGLDGSQTGTTYTLYRDNSPTSNVITGTGNAISFGNQITAGSYSVVAGTTSGNCTNNMNGAATITVDPQAPLTPGEPAGPSQVFSGAMPTTDYTTTGGTYATTYLWEITPANAGAITGTATTGTATWNQLYVGAANIKVQGVNSCGGGSYSAEFVVTVDVGVGLPEHFGSKLFSVYPNPAKSSFTIFPVKTMKANISILNALGAIVKEMTDVNLSGRYIVDIYSLASGVYFIRIDSGEGRQIVKLVVE